MRVRRILWTGNDDHMKYRVVELYGPTKDIEVQYFMDGKWKIEYEGEDGKAFYMLSKAFKETIEDYNGLKLAYDFERSIPKTEEYK
jgi:hypothetical protein